MRTTMATIAAAFMLLVSSCGPTADEIATMTASAWTPTPAPTPTATPIPYDLTVHVMDGSGAPVPSTNGSTLETASQAPLQADASGALNWRNLPGPTANITVSAPGYFPASQSVSMDRGLTELALTLQRDPFGLTAADACAPDEKPLYIEDFQDGKAQGWKNITAATDFGAQNGWAVSPKEEGNLVASFSGIYENLDDLAGFTLDNFVWRLKIQAQGTDGFSFLNLKHAPKPGGETRYPVQWGATPFLALTRLDFPDVGHFPVKVSSLRVKQGQWYYAELSVYQGTIQVWINGKKLIDYTDPQPLPAGTISLEAHIQHDAKTAYYFDDLSVCELSAPFATSLYRPPAP